MGESDDAGPHRLRHAGRRAARPGCLVPPRSRPGKVRVDETYMRRALELAQRGRGLASPNPVVGAVVVRGGEVVGEGWHEGPGTPHAEAVALAEAGDRARGSTLYVSLEPCDHQGRTPPCTRAIVDAGVATVVAAMQDPNPIVDGRGFERLRGRGVEVRVGLLEREARRQLEAFDRHIRTALPFVTLKMAASLDGKVAARDGSSRWITGERAREEVHQMRAASDAIAVGAGAALVDDPSLTVRGAERRGPPPLRVLVDARGGVGAGARLLDDRAPTLVATTERAPEERRAAWAAAGADVVVFEAQAGRVPIDALMAHLGKRGVQALLLEGGPTLAWSALREGFVDRLVLFLAPKLLGGERAAGILGGDGFAPVGEALRVEIEGVERLGEDIRVEARVHRDR
jgi:diaminohydroxyphosphoribosylaminopyrimidine deaminase / 5-amino-6-(5-phosphoribosylamino)uracil reductase